MLQCLIHASAPPTRVHAVGKSSCQGHATYAATASTGTGYNGTFVDSLQLHNTGWAVNCAALHD